MQRRLDVQLGGRLFAYDDYERGGEGWEARLTSLLLFSEMAKGGRAAINA